MVLVYEKAKLVVRVILMLAKTAVVQSVEVTQSRLDNLTAFTLLVFLAKHEP